MRLREISELVRDVLEGDPEAFLAGEAHALIQDVQDVHTVYRPIANGRRNAKAMPWLTFSFEPFGGLIEPYRIYPGRFWALTRVQRQPSGLPELVTHVDRELASSSKAIEPNLYTSFSHSPKVQTIIEKEGKNPAMLRFFHRGALLGPDQIRLPTEACLDAIGMALPEGYVDDDVPGVVERDGERMLYLGELKFYNDFRTADRSRLRDFIFNNVATAIVARYAIEMVESDA